MQKYLAAAGEFVTSMGGCTNLTDNLIPFLFGGWNFTTPPLTLKKSFERFFTTAFPGFGRLVFKKTAVKYFNSAAIYGM